MRLIEVDADTLKEKIIDHFGDGDKTRAFLSVIDSTSSYIPPLPSPTRILTREELLAAEYGDLTPEEKERVRRCEAIPEMVVELCRAEHKRLNNEVMEREKRMDTICDYLNGYDMTPKIPF